MKYDIVMSRNAIKDLANIQKEYAVKIRNKITELAENPRNNAVVKLKFRNSWRIRIGDFRVIFDINNEEKRVYILRIAHRRNIYNLN